MINNIKTGEHRVYCRMKACYMITIQGYTQLETSKAVDRVCKANGIVKQPR